MMQDDYGNRNPHRRFSHRLPPSHMLHGLPPWRRARRRLFFRFVRLLVWFTVLLLGAVAVLAYLLAHLLGAEGHAAQYVWLGGCGLGLLLPLLALGLAFYSFRSVANPLADVMAAADRVAEGDLGVRVAVPARGPREFARLADTFNRMAEELQRADQQRRNLTADVAHELRTPLQIIQGNLEGVLDGVYEPTPDHLRATLEETRLLTRLVDDLRTLSLAESGQLPLEIEAVDVAELLEDVRTSFSGQVEAAGIALRVETAGSPAALTIQGDVGRLDQVLGNLVTNALRHTPAGGAIVLSAAPLPQGVQLVIRDTGEGIPPEDLPYVFDRFWRGDRARSRTGGAGSGLGLAIARQLVHAHGGHIRVESAPGQGTVFTLELPGEPES